jgi:transposase
MKTNHPDTHASDHHHTSLNGGVDVSKDTLDISIAGESSRVPNNLKSILSWLKKLKASSSQPIRIGCEATSRYHHALITACLMSDIEVYEINPRLIRDFARSHNHLAKTDRIDASVIALFVSQRGLRPISQEWFEQQQLAQKYRRLRTLIGIAAAQKASLHQYPEKSIQREINRLIKVLEKQIAGYIEEIENLLMSNTATAGLYRDLQEEPGVGQRTALAILVSLPELGKVNRQCVAAIAGLAPFNWDSGTMRGKRHIKGGRSLLRSALYMAALPAARCHPQLKPFYKELRERGKPAKLALTAVARKLLIIINSRAKNYYATI